jgi:hypothetical protein
MALLASVPFMWARLLVDWSKLGNCKRKRTLFGVLEIAILETRIQIAQISVL